MIIATQVTEEKLNSTAKPFLKWAGGKAQLLRHLRKLVPTNYEKFIEPFIGGGASFFCDGKF